MLGRHIGHSEVTGSHAGWAGSQRPEVRLLDGSEPAAAAHGDAVTQDGGATTASAADWSIYIQYTTAARRRFCMLTV